MKLRKVLLLLILPLLLNGCYDYQEITDLGIIVALGIDYQDNKYFITYEVLEDNKDKQSGITSSYTITGSDSNLAKACEITSSKMNKKAYYSHIDIVLFSTKLAKEHFKEVTDFILRNKDIREDFDTVIVDDPKNVLESTTPKLKVIGSNIISNIESDEYSSGLSLEKKYSDVTSEILTYGKDTIIPKIDIINGDIVLEGLSIFKDYRFITVLNNQNSTTYNIIKNNSKKIILNNKYNNLDFSIAVYNSKIDINLDNNIISINGNVYSEILENNPNFNIKNNKILKRIEKDFTIILNSYIANLINTLKYNSSDVLGITENYYKTHRLKNDKLWLYSNVKTNVKVIISKKGIIYEVDNND